MTTYGSLKLWLVSHKRKIAEMGTGLFLYGIFNWVFNYPLYMAVVGYYGLVYGGLLMAFLSFIQCGILLVVFDKMKIDWVGATYLEDVERQKDKKSRIEKILVWALKKESQSASGKIAKTGIFLVLSAFVDPFIVAVHYRRKQFTGVNLRDWGILFVAVLIANLYWTLRTGILVLAVKELWQRI